MCCTYKKFILEPKLSTSSLFGDSGSLATRTVMMRPRNRSRPSLRGGLDRDVHQIVKKLQDDRVSEAKDGKPPRLTVSAAYEAIKRSNSSLSRQKKRPLEESIERVLEFVREESSDDSSSDDKLDLPPKKVRESSPLTVVASSGGRFSHSIGRGPLPTE